MKEQRPVDSQNPEQQPELLVQASPSVLQPLPRVTQVPPPPGGEQLSLQHCALVVQLPPACVQLPVVEQRPPTQLSEQQSAACAQAAPGGLHSLVSMQRKTPPGSFSHNPEQHAGELLGVHRSPTSLQALAGCSHLPLTQLSEQQSVLTLQVWWKPLQVAQLTPTKQELPKQQPLVQVVASQTQVALMPVPEQRVPAGQAPPVEPQTHDFAVVSQRLVLVPTQEMQAVPAAPHAVSVSRVQVEPLQQPFGHSVELQPEQTPSGLGDWPQLPPAPHEMQVEPL
jgi:hypothetical protein